MTEGGGRWRKVEERKEGGEWNEGRKEVRKEGGVCEGNSR
jgi:hypothetical protein